MAGKTSTFTIHHDRCDVSKWTIAEWKTLARFIDKTKADLARLLNGPAPYAEE